ncbi:MAG: PD40 domain-containing protein [Elusimicrobia bacterium]|nr:PD40 domain-containing protein [Elusimicrobiota bacterium]
MIPAIAALLLAAAPVAAGEFGQNRLVTRDIEWSVRSTDHFDIYYYPDSRPLVEEAAASLEESFAAVTRGFDVETTTVPPASRRPGGPSWWKRRPFFLYASPNDFLESSIVEVGEGTGGVTEPFKDRFMVYNDGTRKWLREVIKHEFTHVVQYHVLNAGFWKSGRILRSILYPLWMMEGWAAHATADVEDTWEEITIRDAATSDGLIPLTRLEHFGHLKPHQVVLAYKEGAAAMGFIASEYGERKMGNMLKTMETHFEAGAVLQANIGLDAAEFDRKFREYAEAKYGRVVRQERLQEPQAYGPALTRAKGTLAEHNSTPVFSPDGSRMYFLSTRGGFPPEVRQLETATGKARRLSAVSRTRVENIPLGHFTNLSRELAISRDGRRLAFPGTLCHRDYIFLYDLRERRGRRKLSRIAMPGLSAVSQPSFSPDGGSIVFSGLKGCRSDLYLHDLASGRTERLTADDRDDQMPAFAPSGDWIVFSAEVPDAREPGGVGRRLHRLFLADRRVEQLERLTGSSRDPVVSADGTRVLFALEGGGFSELAELDLAAGRAVRLTRSIGGSFAPTYAPDGDIAFAALRRGSVHIHKARRDFLLDEGLFQPSAPEPGLAAEPGAPGGAARRPGEAARQGGAAPALTSERPYRFEAGTDLFLPAFFYSTDGGLFWTSYWQGSDLLGRHQSNVMLAYGSDRSYFDYTVSYGYRRYRPELVAAVLGRGQRNLYDPGRGLDFNGALHAQYAGVSYPLDRYHRVELGVTSGTERIKYHDSPLRQNRETRTAAAAVVRDTVRGRYLVATEGTRLRVAAAKSWDVLGGNQRYEVLSAEGHGFLPTGGLTTLASRAVFLRSIGRDHPAFILGGVGGVRGYARSTSENLASQLALGNLEWRFPILKDLNWYMWFFVPDFYFKAIYGTIFTDAGYMWDSGRTFAKARWNDVRHSYGAGIRIHTFIMQEFPLVVSMDYAQQTAKDRGIFYVYLGYLF